jgi:hypothetical protein
MMAGNGVKIAPDSVTYVDSGLYNPSRTLALSYLHKAIKPLNQLQMVEDALVIYRITRAPERRLFYIDVGNLPAKKAEQYLHDIMTKYKNKLVYDASTGEIRDNRRFSTMLEDYWLPRREGGKGTEVSTLQGGQNLGEISDITYFLNKLYNSLTVPISRLQPDNAFNLGRTTEITRDEIKFNKFIKRLRNRFVMIFSDMLQTQLILKGIITSKEEFQKLSTSFKYIWNEDSYFSDLKETEVLSDKINIINNMQGLIGTYFSKDWVKRNILKQSEEDIKQIEKEIKEEPKPEPEKDQENNGYYQ